MRLIDADALMDVIRQHEYSLATKQGSVDYGMFTLGIQQAVDESTTIDAVPVTRCKDCKHWDWLLMECKNDSVSTDNEGGASYSLNFYLDDFCSYGERRSE